MQKLLLTGPLLLLTSPLLFTTPAIAAETFGTPGRDGTPGRSGRPGTPTADQTLTLTSPQTLTFTGSNGEPGEDATSGENATNCTQPPRTPHNLRGANGGNGASGGNGGPGSNGANITLFYTTLPQLQTLQLSNPGGSGGRGGRSSSPGRACTPADTDWTLERCEAVLRRRPIGDPNAPWKTLEHHRHDCDSDHRSRRSDRRDHKSSTHEFKWEDRGIVEHNRYRAEAGQDGTPGRHGTDGPNGQYGNVRLVTGTTIPTEVLSYASPINAITGQPITLLKNNWLTQTGLPQLLASGSNVPDAYQQLQTLRHSFQIDWQTPKTFAQLGNPQITATLNAAGTPSFALPGHLETRQTQAPGQTRIAIVNGIDPDRLRQLKFRGFNQFQDARNFALIDDGKLLKEIAAMRITITVSDDQQTLEDIYTIADTNGKIISSNTITALGDIYKLQLSDKFRPLLQSAKMLTYDVRIEQTARSGVRYPSHIRVKQVVNQVTFPEVEYLSVP